MDHLGLVKAIDRLGQGVVITVADTPDRRLDPGLGEALGLFDRYIMGGFNRSSQHPYQGGCDEGSQTRFGSVYAQQAAFT